jgi:hypothetical protein
LTAEKCKPLSGLNVVLFPDVKGFDIWNEKMKELSIQMPGTRFNISDLLELNATDEEREQGCDIADYLIQFDWKQFLDTPSNLKPLPDWYIKAEKIFNEIRIKHEPMHLLPSMNDKSYIIDAMDF